MDQGDNTVGEVLALYVTESDLTLASHLIPWVPPGVIPEHQERSELWAQLDVAPISKGKAEMVWLFYKELH